MVAGLDLYHTDPALHLITAGEELDGVDHDLSDLSKAARVPRESL